MRMLHFSNNIGDIYINVDKIVGLSYLRETNKTYIYVGNGDPDNHYIFDGDITSRIRKAFLRLDKGVYVADVEVDDV